MDICECGKSFSKRKSFTNHHRYCPNGMPESVKKHMSECKTGEKNPMWKESGYGLSSIHEWVKRRFPPVNKCTNCGAFGKTDLANISQKYLRNLSDWKYICRKCHMIEDGRLENFRQSCPNSHYEQN